MCRTLVGTLSLILCSTAAGAHRDALDVSSSMQNPAPVTQVTVTGEVQTPGSSAADGPLTLPAAIARGGGFTADAAVIEVRHRNSGAGPITAATPASEYHSLYVMRADVANNAPNSPFVFGGDFIVVRRVLEIHPPMPAGTFGAGAYRLDWTTWGVTRAVVRTSSEPQYTQAGMSLKLQGTVELEVVVKADGTVGEARVSRGLDARLPELVAELKRIGGTHSDAVLQIVGNGPIGLDANALDCVRTWTFEPGTILGKAAPVVQTVSVPFKLR